jgi:hypothetical protein
MNSDNTAHQLQSTVAFPSKTDNNLNTNRSHFWKDSTGRPEATPGSNGGTRGGRRNGARATPKNGAVAASDFSKCARVKSNTMAGLSVAAHATQSTDCDRMDTFLPSVRSQARNNQPAIRLRGSQQTTLDKGALMATGVIDPLLLEANGGSAQPELLISAALHLMPHYSANSGQAGACVKLAAVIERHLKALADLPSSHRCCGRHASNWQSNGPPRSSAHCRDRPNRAFSRD